MIDLTDKTYKLIYQIYENFIFYMPSTVFENDLIKRFSINMPNDNYKTVVDEILYIWDGSIYKYLDKPLEQSFAPQKIIILKENIFDLFGLKESLEKDSFNHILETYLGQLRFFKSLSDLLVEKFDTYSPLKDSQLNSLFGLQNLILKDHLNEVEIKFSAKNIGFDSIDKLYRNDRINETESGINCPTSNTTKPNINKKEHFRDFILHEKNGDIEKIVIEKFSHIKGKQMRYLLEHFIDNNLITIVYGSRKKIYESLQNTLEREIGSYSSIFGFEISKVDPDYKKMKNEFIKVFKDIF